MAQRELFAACGVCCEMCGVLIAHRDRNEKFKERLSTVFSCALKEIACQRCFSKVRFK